jgi:hypothetical protein
MGKGTSQWFRPIATSSSVVSLLGIMVAFILSALFYGGRLEMVRDGLGGLRNKKAADCPPRAATELRNKKSPVRKGSPPGKV